TGAAEDAPLPSDLRSALSAFAETPGQEWHALAADYALVIGHLQVLLDSRAAFLHGPVTALGEPFCKAIVRQLPAECPPLELHPTILGDDAGALGAASLAMEAWRPEGP
ncbi:MAG: hypothetical protein KDL87_10490, partial [Verrucomicrobiae bacterium]|nr:hypothetical protein [Verrucomicrobiae bacterium]